MSDNLSDALAHAGFAPVASPVPGVAAFVGVGNGADHIAPITSDIAPEAAKPTRKPRVLSAKPATPVADNADNAASDKAANAAPSQGAQSDAAALIGHLRAKRSHRTRLADSIKDATPSARAAMLVTLAERDAEIVQLEKRVSRLPKALRVTAKARDTRAGIAASVTRYAAQLRQFRKGTPTHGKIAAKLAEAETKLAALA